MGDNTSGMSLNFRAQDEICTAESTEEITL